MPRNAAHTEYGRRDDLREAILLAADLEDGAAIWKNCPRLAKVVFAEGIERIRDGVLDDCPALKAVYLPSTIRRISRKAFQGSAPMLYFSVPMTIWQLGSTEYCLSPDETLSGLHLPAGPAPLRKLAETPVILLEERQKKLKPGEFRDELRLTELMLPPQVEDIGDEAFFGCRNLRKVILPDGLRRIGKKAFRDTALEEIRIPESVAEIGARAFQNCPVTLIVTPDSCAERYCLKHNISYRMEA